jgi:ribosome-binding protein aMBF1 (putative translation factor)
MTFYNSNAEALAVSESLLRAADTIEREVAVVWPPDQFDDVRVAIRYAAGIIRQEAQTAVGDFGVLRKRRAELGLTIRQAARQANVGETIISYMERGRRSVNTVSGRQYRKFLGLED